VEVQLKRLNKMRNIFVIGAISAALILNGCREKAKQSSGEMKMEEPVVNSFQKGSIVPNDQVCMVNNEFMGKKQFDVQYDGKTYYGCCQMCKERIPTDASVRSAVDPVSKKLVDKAKAVIAITGDNGEVSYFENKTTYSDYINNSKH